MQQQQQLKTLKFSRMWTKLANHQFTTIRVNSHWKLDDVVQVLTPDGNFKAQIFWVDNTKVGYIPMRVLKADVEPEIVNTTAEFCHILQRFYQQKIGLGTEVTVLHLRRLEQ